MRNLDNAAFWNRCFAQTPANHEFLGSDKFSATIGRLREYKAKKVLDVGCGYGNWAIALAKSGFEVTASDLSSEALRIVNDRAKRERIHVSTIVCPAQNIEFAKASFDAVICNSVLDHMRLTDTKRSVKNIVKILKTGGIAYMSFDGFEREDPNSYSILEDGTWLFKKGKHAGMLWRYYTNNEIIDLCGDTKVVGFSVKSNGKRNVWFVKK